jgi:hypothetical protein
MRGPLLAYMAECSSGDCSTEDATKLKWFKVAQDGLKPGFNNTDNLGWHQYLLANPETYNIGWTHSIPKNLRPGKYLMRHEMIWLPPTSGNTMVYQFYPYCSQYELGGSGTSFPTEEYLVKFPGAYNETSGKRDVPLPVFW